MPFVKPKSLTTPPHIDTTKFFRKHGGGLWRSANSSKCLCPRSLTARPWKSSLPNRKVVFQPPLLRGELLNFCGLPFVLERRTEIVKRVPLPSRYGRKALFIPMRSQLKALRIANTKQQQKWSFRKAPVYKRWCNQIFLELAPIYQSSDFLRIVFYV